MDPALLSPVAAFQAEVEKVKPMPKMVNIICVTWQAISVAAADVMQWERFQAEYRQLRATLASLPDTTSHAAMVSAWAWCCSVE